MRSVAAASLALAAAACASAPRPLTEAELLVYPEARGMPADVQDFIVRWTACSHWSGEPGWDEARQRQIERAVAEACPGIDERGRRVRARHAGNAEVIARIAELGPLEQ
jgi:hypothetical protein